MKCRLVTVVSLSAVVLTALVGLLGPGRSDWTPGSAAGPIYRLVIPGIAANPPAGPTVTTSRNVIVSVALDINEPALVGSGTTVVRIRATANGPLPGQFDPPVTVPVSVTITTHPSDVCSWVPNVTSPNATLTYSQPQGSDLKLHLNFSNFEWYYQVICPGAQPIRFPAGSVNESVTGWLALIFPGLGGPGGATIDTPVASGGQDCVKRTGLESNTNTFGAGAIHVYVTQPPCLVAVP